MSTDPGASQPQAGNEAAPPDEPDNSGSIEIAAPPARVWQLISDIPRMNEWSPETYRCEWIDGATRAEPGARFKGYNRWNRIRWDTTVEVEVADPERELTFVTRYGKKTLGARWSYRLEPTAGGTRVTETRTELWRSRTLGAFEAIFMRGHRSSFGDGIARTLANLKAAAESETATAA